MTERVLIGPFLTRADAAVRAGIRSRPVRLRPDLLRITSHWLPEAYFEFQFDDDGVRQELADVIETLKSDHDDLAIADWLSRPHSHLNTLSPLGWLDAGNSTRRIAEAAAREGPT